MTNPLYSQFGQKQQAANNDGVLSLMKEVRKLQQTMKNPRQQVEKLIQEGQMTQQQFDEYSQIANQIMKNV